MKQTLKFLFVGAFALLGFVACTDDVTPVEQPIIDSGPDEEYYASIATISSDDPRFTKTEEGGDILFALASTTLLVNVNCGCDWYYTSANGDGWLSLSSTQNTLTISVDNFKSEDLRTARIVFATAVDGIKFATINLTQTGVLYLNLNKKTLILPREGGSGTVTVDTNAGWDYSYDESDTWFKLEKDGSDIVVTAEEYDGSGNRESVVTVTADDGYSTKEEEQFTVVQMGDALILTYNITSAGTTTKLPLSGTVDCTVDWGDGNTETITSAQPSHTFAAAGEYDITVTGKVSALSSDGISTSADPIPLTAVKQWGLTGLTDMTSAFVYCGNLETLPTHTGDAFAEVTSFRNFCALCPKLKEIPVGIFDNCPEVTTFRSVFDRCSIITSIPAGLFDNCPKAETFYLAFNEDHALKEIPAGLFDYCTEATNFYAVFDECESLTEIPEGLFDKNTKAENFMYAFEYCSSLVKIPVGLFENCVSATNFGCAFRYTAIEEVPSKLFGNCPAATDFSYCFSTCKSLATIAEDAFNCPNATDMSYLFAYCSSLTEIPEDLFINCPEVTTFQSAFTDASSLISIFGGLFANCLKVENFNYIFRNCTSLTALPEGLFSNCPEITSLNYLFYGCTKLATIPANLFNAPKVTSFNNTFYNCYAIEVLPEGLFDNCPEVTSFQATFYNCTGLTTVPTSIFSKNTKVTSFQQTFRGAADWAEESPYDLIKDEKVHLYERADYTNYYATPTSTGNCFTNCKSLTDYSDIPSTWGGGKY